jgi:CelD/BcsL family acetyltransferase involved in cellulose biosynthesis
MSADAARRAGQVMSKPDFSRQIVRPSALGTSDIAAWHAMMQGLPFLQRGFYAPEFAIACERAHDLARVIILRNNEAPVAFFPFQYASPWHRLTGAGERIGGSLSDHAGLIASPGFRIDPGTLLDAVRLRAFFATHLAEGQAGFGLPGSDWRIGHVVDLRDGTDEYFQKLAQDRSDFARDTRRRLKRAEKDFGALDFVFDAEPAVALDAIEAKRRQYARTGVGDVFQDDRNVAIIKALFEHSSSHCRPVVSVLRAGGKIIARHLGLMSGGVLSYWFPVYEPAARAVSPGRLLLWQIIEAATREGITLIDRGEGDSRAKQDFSTGVQRFGKAYWYRGAVALPARLQMSLEWRIKARRAEKAGVSEP